MAKFKKGDEVMIIENHFVISEVRECEGGRVEYEGTHESGHDWTLYEEDIMSLEILPEEDESYEVTFDTLDQAFDWLLCDYQDKYTGVVLDLLDHHIDKLSYVLECGFEKLNNKWVKPYN